MWQSARVWLCPSTGRQGAIVFEAKHSMRIVFEPCFTHTQMYLQSDIERDHDTRKRRRVFAETYRWIDRELELERVVALDPADEHVLSG
ncbi:MAG: hypothetical protein WB677_28510, partial [Xanthobacteraceae bacterium]